MASELIPFKKELEDVIIKGNLKEALNSLIPNSIEFIYLEFCEEYKKCNSRKIMSKELISILEKAKKISYDLYEVLKTRKDLLEYDLSRTTKKRKNEIIDGLYERYCNKMLNYKAPFFVKEKLKQDNDMEIENEDVNNSKAILELTDDIIKKKVEKIFENDLDFIKIERYFYYISDSKRIEIILKCIEKNSEKAAIIIDRNNVPFYLMKKDEFSKVIKVFNSCKYNINDFRNMTREQIERILNEVNNPKYISKDKIISKLINKKYNKLLEDAGNNLIELKNILVDIYNILTKFS